MSEKMAKLFSVTIYGNRDFFITRLVVAKDEEQALKKACFANHLLDAVVKDAYRGSKRLVDVVDDYKIKLERVAE